MIKSPIDDRQNLNTIIIPFRVSEVEFKGMFDRVKAEGIVYLRAFFLVYWRKGHDRNPHYQSDYGRERRLVRAARHL
jgi:hypothetical protein